jgi:V/A-type H+-transporting ATPase subunit B
MKNIEFRTATSAQGGLIVMGGVPGVSAGSRVSLKDHAGNLRNGLVIRAADDAVLVEVFEGTDDLDLERTWVRFLDEPFKLPVSRDILGRVFNGAGLPRDGRPPIISADRRDVNGEPLNPAARAYPREFIQTGISAIDGMNSLTRGQKLPIFSGGGLPHNRVAAQIVRQAKLLGEESSEFVVVFAAFGASHADARFFQESFEESPACSTRW